MIVCLLTVIEVVSFNKFYFWYIFSVGLKWTLIIYVAL